ncbi:M23 family metallopeptidase [Paenibacillus ferrarius]|uniref:M23 family metallopeptidase n=1 Tax=Paenibacillus ferrarius TaxID=1469647 RepID=UPI001FCA0D64|nr:M23 family metallopeptidase [Paenibacillus ferrarius]
MGFSESTFSIKVPIGAVTSPYGSIDSVHHTPHTGIDLYCTINSPIFAPLDGVISKVHDYGNAGLGKAVFVRMNDGRQYIMGHLNEIKVHAGDKIIKGDLLGLSGNTGHSTGAHLHFAAVDKNGRFIDPETLFESIHSGFILWTQKVVTFSDSSYTVFASNYAAPTNVDSSSMLFKLLDAAVYIF